ncbi:lysophospholipid acyltransferase family protein [Amphritea sp. 2_MG-2023]|uniref:lysophospholipid acyltransferase family protein n=1 Tax=Amphritea TaxID=515417 RepID=UPI001C0692A2|nr:MULTISPECIES: lysophospholipid acyltransferase family protein [Amphritea]MBU2964001.1 1-acyl-sn-glycerol-3-phosphate acyltransferase [Amphritea atlantica]MDO6420295.1 lysophospholipid acyltransferase family protein [Amphritea sp. 2_MG-2023]
MTRQPSLFLYLRATLFYIGFYPVTLLFAAFCLLVGWALPFRPRFKLFTLMNYFSMAWLYLCCGVKYRVEGRENLPKDRAYVLVANHSSEWETLFLQTLVRPQSAVLKQELLQIPLFGWALAMLKPIALDRSKRRGALKQLLTQGKERLAEGINVVIFPQGTRVEAGKLGKFNKGGAMLAASAQAPIVPLAHDAGLFWPGKSYVKYPGTITVRIGAAVESVDRSVDEIHSDSIGWLEAQMRDLKIVDE